MTLFERALEEAESDWDEGFDEKAEYIADHAELADDEAPTEAQVAQARIEWTYATAQKRIDDGDYHPDAGRY